MDTLIIYTDGGSRGNPGPSAIGVAFVDARTGQPLHTYGERVQDGTNNEAEYKAIIFALKKAKQLYGKEKAKKMIIDMRMDSELAVRQLNGQYKLSTPHIQQLFIEVWNLKTDFAGVAFMHVRREQNTLADKMVNEALDN
ncbi:ribonuclease HI family protein [Candidatus Azambacteria bacterium]|nr:ribonuclease HI family protein [Candidatus Azambacteria bacterium]